MTVESSWDGIELGKAGFRESLKRLLSGYPHIDDIVRHIGYDKHSLGELFRRHNARDYRRFPFARFGLAAGYKFNRLIQFNTNNTYDPHLVNQGLQLSDLNIKSDGGGAIGIFMDFPISYSRFTLHPELYISRHGYAAFARRGSQDLSFVANMSSLHFPCLVRYSVSSGKMQPFLSAGMQATWHYKNESLLLKTTFTEDQEVADFFSSQAIADTQLGLSLGAGVEYWIGYKSSIFFELRLSRDYGLSGDKRFDMSDIHFLTGIAF